MNRPWGCPTCKHDVALVRDTGRDDEGYKVRLRECVRCGTLWATEEVPIAVTAFYIRNASRRRNNRERMRKQAGRRTCQWCGQDYLAGTYRRHCGESKRHRMALTPRHRSVDRYETMRYQREWKRQAGERRAA